MEAERWMRLPSYVLVSSYLLIVVAMVMRDWRGDLIVEHVEDYNVLQFWKLDGDMSLEEAARSFFASRFSDCSIYWIGRGENGVSVFAFLFRESDAWRLHGKLAWIDNTLICCAKVDPLLPYVEDLVEGNMPDVVFRF